MEFWKWKRARGASRRTLRLLTRTTRRMDLSFMETVKTVVFCDKGQEMLIVYPREVGKELTIMSGL